MKEFTDAKRLVANLSAQLTKERLAEVRCLSGIGYMPPGSLEQSIEDETFSMEDIMTVLLSSSMLQTEEIKLKEQRISELEDLCNFQRKSINEIADQAIRLSFMVGSIFPNEAPVSPFDMLKKISSTAR